MDGCPPPDPVEEDDDDDPTRRVYEPMPWAAHARCRGDDANALFFDGPNERPETRAARECFVVTEYCWACPVVVECRDYARRNREYGIWGGETEEERIVAGYIPKLLIGTLDRLARGVREGVVS